MKWKNIPLVICLVLAIGLLTLFSLPAAASPQQQVYYQTPTPDVDGRIIYVVQPNDSCLRISLLTKVDQNTIRTLNNLDENCTIVVGSKLLLGVVKEPSATPGPTPTPTPALPTSTPFNGSGKICVFLYEDINGNGISETGEAQIPNGAVNITDKAGRISLSGKTPSGDNPLCFTDNLAEGEYNISVAPPQGYNPTTNMNYALTLKAGDASTLDFGAQKSSVPPEKPGQAAGQSPTSPLLAIIGLVLVLGGIGLGVYVLRTRK